MLEPSGIVLNRENNAGDMTSFYCEVNRSRYQWVDVPAESTDEDKAAAIRAALGVS